MGEHKQNEPSQNAQEQRSDKQQGDNDSSATQRNQPIEETKDLTGSKEDERTGEGTGARAGEYS